MINEIKMLSPAKLNLYLEVINRTSDGFHNLKSLMCFCDFGDIIQIRKARNFSFSINGPFSENLEKNNNIITSSVLFIENLIKKKIEVEISLTKNIPIASGMGGGSSNAATTIICLKKLFNLKFDTYFLSSLFKLGADIPFCYYRESAFVEGKGEKVKLLKKKIPEFLILLVNPRKEISTKLIFSKLKINGKKSSKFDNKLIDSSNFIDFLKSKNNDLEYPAMSQCNEIKSIIDFLDKETKSFLCRMTGSGATCFGIYENKEDLVLAEKLINKNFKDFWTKKTRIVNKI